MPQLGGQMPWWFWVWLVVVWAIITVVWLTGCTTTQLTVGGQPTGPGFTMERQNFLRNATTVLVIAPLDGQMVVYHYSSEEPLSEELKAALGEAQQTIRFGLLGAVLGPLTGVGVGPGAGVGVGIGRVLELLPWGGNCQQSMSIDTPDPPK